MVAGPIVGEAIGGPEDSCLLSGYNVELDNRLRWTSPRCSLSQFMVGGGAGEKKRSDLMADEEIWGQIMYPEVDLNSLKVKENVQQSNPTLIE